MADITAMKTIYYEQHWLMSDWITDDTGLADRIFFSQPEIAWLISQGHRPEFSRMADLEMESMKYMIRFQVPEDEYLLLLLRWPNHIHMKVEI